MTKQTNLPKVGDEMKDGTILAGYYLGKALYTTPSDVPGHFTFNNAAEHPRNLTAHGHHDWRPPSIGELNVLCENQDKGKLKGTFETASSPEFPYGWYWSSEPLSEEEFDGWAQRFNGYGEQRHQYMSTALSLRLVRG
jgi:hypothetical protein